MSASSSPELETLGRDETDLVRAVRQQVIDDQRGSLEFRAEPPIRVMARLVQQIERACEARGLDPDIVRAEVVNRTIGDVNTRTVDECLGEPGGPLDYRTLADDLGIALPGERINGSTASGTTYLWLREEMQRQERALLAQGHDLRLYDINAVGNPVLRGWLAADAQGWGLDATAEQVALGIGANDCIDKVLRGLAQESRMAGTAPGAVVFPGPGFNMPEVQADFYGFRLSRLTTRPDDGFRVTAGMLDQHLQDNPDVRAVYLAVANNPTARLYSADELHAIRRVLLGHATPAHPVHLLVDLAYVGTADPALDQPSLRALAARPQPGESVIYVGSYSKTHTLTGDRFGWVVFSDPALAVDMRAGWMSTVSTLPAEWQLRFMAYHRLFVSQPRVLDKVRGLYRLRRQRLRDQLERLNSDHVFLDRIYPDDDSTIYVWCRLRPGHDCYTVLARTGIAGIPGSTFGYSDDYVRFSVGTLPVPGR